MSANVHPLPSAQPRPAVEHDRGDWGALRAELHSRCADEDLATLWAELEPGERRTLMASARLPQRDPRVGIHELPKPSREALRAAVHRMSQYASRLRDNLGGHRPHPSRELASHARQALAEGNTEAALHWLAIIERGVA
ncbi:hypothetical protein [Halomonas organivorans]|uniref:Uncharacterized protein n=1 Tax=Halomonas organivorans TaxID=257772 RepID=A0A7W5G5L1_9GAMM|nr:hypothetical protein [Halomonas organivorans]MBB3141244.1 hypothetical protein [Halomonas organivorans]